MLLFLIVFHKRMSIFFLLLLNFQMKSFMRLFQLIMILLCDEKILHYKKVVKKERKIHETYSDEINHFLCCLAFFFALSAFLSFLASSFLVVVIRAIVLRSRHNAREYQQIRQTDILERSHVAALAKRARDVLSQ